MNDYRPRISFEITEEQKRRADNLINAHGLRKALLGIILDDLLDLIEEEGGLAIGLILSRKLKPREVIPSMHKEEK